MVMIGEAELYLLFREVLRDCTRKYLIKDELAILGTENNCDY
jgi:hypothetical protein